MNNQIHMTPEEIFAQSQAESLQGMRVESRNGMEENNGILADISDKVDPTPVLSKLEEINQKEYPTEMAVTMKGISIITLKGDKGDQGIQGIQGIEGSKGIQGEKGETGESGQSIQGPQGEKGDRGDKGEKGDSIKGDKGDVGKDGKNGKDGKDGSPDTPDEVVEKVNKSKKTINSDRVDGLKDVIKYVDNVGKYPTGKGSGGQTLRLRDSTGAIISAHVTDLKFSTGLTPVYSGNGLVTLSSSGSGGGHAIQEEGTPLTQRTNLNFVGATVTATDDAGNDATIITISGGGSGITRTVVVTSGSATMGSSASTDYTYFISGAHTMSLPAAAGNTNRYTVKNNHSANITVDTLGAETLEGAASISIVPGGSESLMSDGTNWYVTD